MACWLVGGPVSLQSSWAQKPGLNTLDMAADACAHAPCWVRPGSARLRQLVAVRWRGASVASTRRMDATIHLVSLDSEAGNPVLQEVLRCRFLLPLDMQ